VEGPAGAVLGNLKKKNTKKAAGLQYTKPSAEHQPASNCRWSSANRRRLSANRRRLRANRHRLNECCHRPPAVGEKNRNISFLKDSPSQGWGYLPETSTGECKGGGGALPTST